MNKVRKCIIGINLLAIIAFIAYAHIQTLQPQSIAQNNIPIITPTETATPSSAQPTPSNTLQTTTPTLTPTKQGYKDGNYSESSSTPWGTLAITATIKNGNITAVNADQTPFSAPSQYAVPVLIQEQLASQQTYVSGATTTSQVFSQEISQILQNAQS